MIESMLKTNSHKMFEIMVMVLNSLGGQFFFLVMENHFNIWWLKKKGMIHLNQG
jgi:hypothetical protein